MTDFLKKLDSAGNFQLRQVMERLREGLFDPFGVQLLTAGESRLCRAFDDGVNALEKNSSAHLCICGSYGQGKSHSLTYLRQRALKNGFVTSQINLDPREIPFHDFQRVYRELVTQLRFPDGENSLVNQWKAWTNRFERQISGEEDEWEDDLILDILSEEIPHLFRVILFALAKETVSLSQKERRLKKHEAFRPWEFHDLLSRALMGENVPVYRLRPVFRYRQVPFYKDEPLACRGWEPYLRLVFGLSRLFRQMGFKGWVLLFDEGEAITQCRINSRSKSYEILHRMFFPKFPVPGFYPVFAFTDDFFLQLRQEDYTRVSIRGGVEQTYFERIYATAWHDLNVCRLNDLSDQEWRDLSRKLIALHTRAYGWEPSEEKIHKKMARRLTETRAQESRLKLKSLVDQLDLIHQDQVLGEANTQ